MQPALRTKEEAKGSIKADLRNLELELQKEAQARALEDENPAVAQLEEMIATPVRDTGADEVFLALEPMPSPTQLFRFCNGIHETGSADIAFFSSSPKRTAIKLALRNQIPLTEILNQIAEVEDVQEDPELEIGANWGLPTFDNLRIRNSARVTLKAV